MKKMKPIQKFKLIIQNMRMRFSYIIFYPFIALFIYFFIISNIFGKSMLIYFFTVLFVVLMHFLLVIIELLGILVKDVYLVDGEVEKTYNDFLATFKKGGNNNGQMYKKKYISLFSNRVINRRAPVPSNIRMKIKSNDGKYVSPWISVTNRIFKNRNNYNFKIVLFKNIAITAYYEKK